MAFQTYCDNKGCGEYQAPLLDTETDEVICSECGKPINNLTKFAKTTLRTLGQVKRAVKSQKAFSVECPACKKSAPPVLGPNREILCAHCKEEQTQIKGPYKHVLLQHLSGGKV
jgi:hypothetical protein